MTISITTIKSFVTHIIVLSYLLSVSIYVNLKAADTFGIIMYFVKQAVLKLYTYNA